MTIIVSIALIVICVGCFSIVFSLKSGTKYPRGVVAPLTDVIGHICALIAFAFTPYLFSKFYGRSYVFVGVIVGFILFYVVLGLLKEISIKLRPAPKRELLNEEARIILTALKQRRRADPYWLFLRPFDVEHSIKVPNPFHGLAEDSHLELENALARVLEGTGLLAALGLSETHPDYGCMEVPDEEWKDCFGRLAHGAKGIVVLPFASTGTMWEVTWLKEHNKLMKCVFVMPPDLTPELIQRWSFSHNELRKIGFMLPDYVKEGLLFRTTSNEKTREMICTSYLKVYYQRQFSTSPPSSDIGYLEVNHNDMRESICGLIEGGAGYYTLEEWLRLRGQILSKVGKTRSAWEDSLIRRNA